MRIKYCVISRGWFFHLAVSWYRGKVLTGSTYGFRKLLPKLCFLALPLLFSPTALSGHTYSSHALSDIRQPDRHVTCVQPSRFTRSFLLSLFSFVASFQATVLIYICLSGHAAGDIAVSVGGGFRGFSAEQLFSDCGNLRDVLFFYWFSFNPIASISLISTNVNSFSLILKKT